jgi:hypothetical protein
MKSSLKNSLTLGALAVAALVVVQMASAQAPRASDKARGFYGPAASPEAADATWLAPGISSVQRGPARSFSYAPAPQTAQPVAPQSVRPAPPAPVAAAPATTTPSPVRRFSYQPRVYRGMTMDRVLNSAPADRNAAAKAQGEY